MFCSRCVCIPATMRSVCVCTVDGGAPAALCHLHTKSLSASDPDLLATPLPRRSRHPHPAKASAVPNLATRSRSARPAKGHDKPVTSYPSSSPLLSSACALGFLLTCLSIQMLAVSMLHADWVLLNHFSAVIVIVHITTLFMLCLFGRDRCLISHRAFLRPHTHCYVRFL